MALPIYEEKMLNIFFLFTKTFENDLPDHLQSSEFTYAEVHGWQTIPQWPWLPRKLFFISFFLFSEAELGFLFKRLTPVRRPFPRGTKRGQYEGTVAGSFANSFRIFRSNKII